MKNGPDLQSRAGDDLRKKVSGLLLVAMLLAWMEMVAMAAEHDRRIPIIDVTDLYHPPQDVGDNFDLIAAYGLAELELRAVIFDCSAPFRQPEAIDPGPGLATDKGGPREPGFIPVLQLNYIFNRNIPCATAPFAMMKSPTDEMHDTPGFQQQGLELLLQVLRDSREPVQVLSFGSARPVAVAYNREPDLFRKKVARVHLCAGATAPGFMEWNVALDTNAFVRLLRSDLPIAIYPCAANNSRRQGNRTYLPVFSFDSHNTYWRLPNLQFARQMDPRLRRYLEFALSRATRIDFLRATEVDSPRDRDLFAREHSVWETAVWLSVTGRRLVRRPDGHYRIVMPGDRQAGDVLLPNELQPCRVSVRENGMFTFESADGNSNFLMYYRGDPVENERALQEALPELYRSFRP